MTRQVFNISREVDYKTSLGNLYQYSVMLIVKNFFLIWRWNILCFILCPLPLVLVTGHHQKESGPILLKPSLKVFLYIDKIPSKPFLLQAKQVQLAQPFPIKRCSSLLIIFITLCWTLSRSSVPLLYWTQYSRVE